MREILTKLTREHIDVHTIVGSLIMLEQMARTLMNIISVANFFKEYEEMLAQSGIKIIQEALKVMENGEDWQKQECALIVKTCVEALCKLIEKLMECKCTSIMVNLFGQNNGIMELLATILMLPMVNEPRMLFEPNPSSNIQKHFNEAKGVILEILKSFINHLYLKYPPQTKLPPLYFHKRIEGILAELNESIYQFRQKSRLPADKLEDSVEKFLTPAMNLIAKSIEIQDFYSIYAAIYKKMVIEVFLPEIVISDREKDSFEQNEVEFVNLAFDTCFNQKSKVSKVLAMKAIENFCDKIDGAISFISVGVLALTDAILGGKSEADILKDVSAVEPFLKSHFLKNHSPEEVLDVCLLVITSISYHIVKRADLL